MDKNKICREILNIGDVLALQLTESLVSSQSLTKEQIKSQTIRFKSIVENNINTIVDKVLEG